MGFPKSDGELSSNLSVFEGIGIALLTMVMSFVMRLGMLISLCPAFEGGGRIVFDQLMVNEYPPEVGLSRHVDTQSAFEDLIFILV